MSVQDAVLCSLGREQVGCLLSSVCYFSSHIPLSLHTAPIGPPCPPLKAPVFPPSAAIVIRLPSTGPRWHVPRLYLTECKLIPGIQFIEPPLSHHPTSNPVASHISSHPPLSLPPFQSVSSPTGLISLPSVCGNESLVLFLPLSCPLAGSLTLSDSIPLPPSHIQHLPSSRSSSPDL